MPRHKTPRPRNDNAPDGGASALVLQAQVLELKRRLEDITRLVSDWVWEADPDLKLTSVSFRIFEVLGYHSLELIGRRLADLGTFLDEDGHPFEPDWQTPFRDVTFLATDRNGAERTFRMSALPTFNTESGVFEGVRGTAEDVTERRRAEEALRESEARVRAVLEHSPSATYLKDLESRYLVVNRRFEEKHGLSEGSAYGRTIRDLLPPEQAENFLDRDQEVIRSREAMTFEHEFRRPDGSHRVEIVTKFPVFGANGAVIGVGGITTDITNRKQAEQALQESEERLRGAVESLQEGFALFDAEDRLVLTNETYRRINPSAREIQETGGTFEDLLRANLRRGVLPEAIGREDDFLRERLERHRNPGPPVFRTYASGRSYVIREGRTPEGGVALTITDITDLKAAQRREAWAHQRLFNAIETIPLGFALFDAEDRLVLFNEIFRSQTKIGRALRPGVSFLEILRRNVEGGVILEAQGREEEWLLERMEQHHNPGGPIDVERSDGWVQIREHRTPDGGTLVVSEDVSERRRVEAAVRESEERFRNLVEGSLLGIVIERNGKPLFVNQAFADIFGYESGDTVLGVKSIYSLCQPHERPRLRRYARAHLKGREAPYRYEFEGLRKDRSPIWVEAQIRVVSWEGEPVLQYTIIDITVQKRLLDNLRQLSQAVEQSPVSVIVTDTEGAIEYVNPKFVEISGYTPDEVLGQNPRLLKSGQTPTEVYEELWDTLATGQEWRGEFLNKKKNGELFWESVSISPIKNANGAVTHYVAVKEDVTLRKEYERRLIQQANYDDVTGLPNRALAMDRLSQELARARRNGRKVALLFIDLDRFKRINDTLGHLVGDTVLRETGQRIRACLRAEDTVARLGGDEFTVILPGLMAALDAETVAMKILAAFRPPLHINGNEIFITPSLGITIWPDDGRTSEALLRNADTAMYQAKEAGRNNIRFFTPEMNERAQVRGHIETQMRHALERDEFTVYFQPIVDLRSGQLVRAEALLRWRNAELGDVPPDQFIPLAEEIGLIARIGEWVLRAACREAKKWHTNQSSEISISVNVSSRQFTTARLAEAVARTLNETDFSAEALELEITENLLLADLPETTRALRELRDMGVRFSVDDFGTGYSSLGYLRRFPVSTLKIDKSFVRALAVDPDHATLVEAIINMARSLKLEVVAEGVETVEQMKFLRRHGCDLAQGYYFSRPLPASDFVRFVEGWNSEIVTGHGKKTKG